MIYVHHHSKGNQATKDSLDRSSGAGAWSRDPDAILDLSEHKKSTPEDRSFTAEITVRDFSPINDFVVRWDFPLLKRDTEGLDPSEQLRGWQPGSGGSVQQQWKDKRDFPYLRVVDALGLSEKPRAVHHGEW
jgi:hypothetical protein